ncbi:MAG: DnaK suppressor protein [Polaribacter sp.]|jgi:DnaK suppressor protein
MLKHERYSEVDLQEFKTLIDTKLEKARAELKYLYDQMVGAENNGDTSSSGDYFDYSSRHVELEMLTKMASRQRMFIRNLENALLRIKNKTYGICNITGTLIRKERLLLVPHATKSIAGKGSSSDGPRNNRQSMNSGPSTRRAS